MKLTGEFASGTVLDELQSLVRIIILRRYEVALAIREITAHRLLRFMQVLRPERFNTDVKLSPQRKIEATLPTP